MTVPPPLVTCRPRHLPALAVARVRLEVPTADDARAAAGLGPACLPAGRVALDVVWTRATLPPAGALPAWAAGARGHALALAGDPEEDWRAVVRRGADLRRLSAALEVDASRTDAATLRFLLSCGHPLHVRIDDPAPAVAARLAALVDYWLHEPAVRTHVEPFRTLLLAGLEPGRRAPGRTLWDLSRERAGQHVHVDGEGRVSLGPRHAAAGRVYARLPETADPAGRLDPAALAGTPAARADAARTAELFRRGSRCASCRAFAACEGWLVSLEPAASGAAGAVGAAGDTVDCAPWLALFDTLRDAARRLAALRRPAPRSEGWDAHRGRSGPAK
jgi:hypothetical protein